MIDEMEQYTGCNVAAKSGDLDEVDKESIHLLVFLFMQFLSCSDQVRFFTKLFVHFRTCVLFSYHSTVTKKLKAMLFLLRPLFLIQSRKKEKDNLHLQSRKHHMQKLFKACIHFQDTMNRYQKTVYKIMFYYKSMKFMLK